MVTMCPNMLLILFFPRTGAETSKARGEKEVRRVDCKKQTQMGKARRFIGDKNYDRRVKILFQTLHKTEVMQLFRTSVLSTRG